MADVTVYTMPNCPWCKKAKEFLKENDVEFEERNVIEDPEARSDLVEKSGQRGVPVIDIQGTVIVGYKPDRIREALKIVEMHREMYDLVIVGGGVAGLAAAIYAGRLMIKTALVAETLGGTIISTDDIANYPGFKRISGLDLTERLQDHLRDYIVETIERKVDRIERCDKGCFKVFSGDEYLHTKTVIFATGTEWRKLAVPGEEEFSGKGVHYCALCDGAFYKDKVIAVVGGSDSAAKEALLLTQFAKKVYIIYRGEKLRPEPVNMRRVQENDKIEVINETEVLAVKGGEFLTQIVLDPPFRGSKDFPVDALFVDIGHVPLSGFARDLGVELNE
ncbi:MAG TPA: FAD-dependent oxidoreductase, partial [Methanotrichaceae archaeon]|nr:FAD-dependent oxidoreductase [Methanotrichaceae archaeon]